MWWWFCLRHNVGGGICSADPVGLEVDRVLSRRMGDLDAGCIIVEKVI